MEINSQYLITNVGYSSHDGSWSWQHVSSPLTRLYLVKEGCAEIVLHDRGQHLKLCPGMLYAIPPHTLHSDRCDGHFAYYYLHIFSTDGCQPMEEYDMAREMRATPFDEMIMRRLCDLMPFAKLQSEAPFVCDTNDVLTRNIASGQTLSEGVRWELSGLLSVLVAHFVQHSKPRQSQPDKRLRKALDYMKNHIGERITVEDLAKESCLSVDYFNRYFARQLHDTPMQYLTARRMEKAEILLNTTTQTIAEIALRVGYADATSFTRAFQKVVGVSPRQYREKGFQASNRL